jgi:biopolymer transport protein ExbD
MRLSNQQQKGAPLALSMTSMIDVVFLLLIFFIVTTTFVRPERQVQSSIKVNEKDAAQEQSDLDPAIVEISRFGDVIQFRIGAIKTNKLDEVEKILRGFEDKAEGAFVRAADNVPFEAAAQAIGVCKSSGFTTVSYLPAN